MNSLPNVEALLKAPLGHPEVIGLLERVLADARAGRVVSVGIVFSAGPGSMQAGAAGGHPSEIFMGCAALQNLLMQAAQGRPSGLVRPG